jgi:hypothetical protein
MRDGALVGLSAASCWLERSARYNRRHKITPDGTSGRLWFVKLPSATFAHQEHPCRMNAPAFTLAISPVGGGVSPCYWRQ